ncbi:hypothetical protein [Pararhizobium qamdonense]|nr:hypothetical protein [Pararhizobium qamdonense]
MQDIRDWLKSRIPELLSFQRDASEKSNFQLEAKASTPDRIVSQRW